MASSPAELKGEIVLTASFTAKPGSGDELEALVGKLLTHAKKNEPGTLEYGIARNGKTESFVTWERFKDMDALKAHSENPLFAELKSSTLVEKAPEVLFYKPVQPAA
ncbi:unnamed protein product [Mycena citricolor]|uniref:ABM domain-containing protein n=1 Tax=Mycena citricolor TaxID=2018698 RepID=A0AAD2H7X5_9AGAR|nr:unnamed protein product [Mycena citricolor]